MDISAENKNKYSALGLTLIFHAILFLIFLWKITTPIPPFTQVPPPEIEIGLGMMGLGNTD
ncbi:MAG TPA: hypothetical protein VLB84_16285, partial [Bacteroidia bacterium]|nr:hypothetical protein [Bacteroidia bacterium]